MEGITATDVAAVTSTPPPSSTTTKVFSCAICRLPIKGTRYVCLMCDGGTFNLCVPCESRHVHMDGAHPLLKINNNNNNNNSFVDEERVQTYKEKLSHLTSSHDDINTSMLDPYTFHKSIKYDFIKQNKNVALPLIKVMLSYENQLRLSEEYISEYAKSQDHGWKSAVTLTIQRRVVEEFLSAGKQSSLFGNEEEGLDFLRGAVGNFPEELEQLKECANYIKYTQLCVRGHLRVGETVDLSQFPLYDPYTLEKELLSDYLINDKPLVIIASSYTCPPFRGQLTEMGELAQTFTSDQVTLMVVYIMEAHAIDTWPFGLPVSYRQTHTISERAAVARDFIEQNNFKTTLKIDEAPSNAFNTFFAAWPLRFYVIEPCNNNNSKGKGKMVYIHEPEGPYVWVKRLHTWLKEHLKC